MKIKNITAKPITIQIGFPTQTIAAGATATFDDTPQAFADVQRWITANVIQLVDANVGAGLVGTVNVPANKLLLATGQPSDGDTVTINGVVFEWDSNATITAGNVAVTIGGTLNLSLRALGAAINANTTLSNLGITYRGVIVVTATSDERLVVEATTTKNSTTPATIVATELTANATWGSTTAAVDLPDYQRFLRAFVATGATQVVVTPFKTIAGAQVTVLNSASTVLNWNGKILIDGGTILLDDSGATDFASGALITVEAFGLVD